MKQIYKIACLICIIVIVIYLKPNTFGLNKFIKDLPIPRLNNNINNKLLINIVCSFISSLNNANFDYQNIIEQKFYIKPKTNNKYITKIVNNFINKTFSIKKKALNFSGTILSNNSKLSFGEQSLEFIEFDTFGLD